MADGVEFDIIGLEELTNTLKQLGPAYKQKGARFAMRKAANLVRDAAKQNALRLDDPATAESIAENVAVRFSNRRFRRTGDVMFRVGVLGGARGYAKASGELKGKGKQNPGGDTYYWRYHEFGTEKMRATPFMRPAISANIDKATTEFVKELDKWTARNLKKLRKAGAVR